MSQNVSWSEYMSQGAACEESEMTHSTFEARRSVFAMLQPQPRKLTALKKDSRSLSQNWQSVGSGNIQVAQHSLSQGLWASSSTSIREQQDGNTRTRAPLHYSQAVRQSTNVEGVSRRRPGGSLNGFERQRDGEPLPETQLQDLANGSSQPSASSFWDRIRKGKSAALQTGGQKFPGPEKKLRKSVSFHPAVHMSAVSQERAAEGSTKKSELFKTSLPPEPPQRRDSLRPHAAGAGKEGDRSSSSIDQGSRSKIPPLSCLLPSKANGLKSVPSLTCSTEQRVVFSQVSQAPHEPFASDEETCPSQCPVVQALSRTGVEAGASQRDSEGLFHADDLFREKLPEQCKSLTAITSALKLETYLEMFVALTGSEASREVKVVSEFDESRFKVKELQQVRPS